MEISMRTKIVGGLVIGVGLIYFIFFKKQESSQVNQRLIGLWLDEKEDVQLELKKDSSFSISISRSRQNFYGKWSVVETIFQGPDTLDLLILKNQKEMENKWDYFEYYFIEIEKIGNNTIKVIDRSRTSNLGSSYRLRRDVD